MKRGRQKNHESWLIHQCSVLMSHLKKILGQPRLSRKSWDMPVHHLSRKPLSYFTIHPLGIQFPSSQLCQVLLKKSNHETTTPWKRNFKVSGPNFQDIQRKHQRTSCSPSGNTAVTSGAMLNASKLRYCKVRGKLKPWDWLVVPSSNPSEQKSYTPED